jgi:hypothetical protein
VSIEKQVNIEDVCNKIVLSHKKTEIQPIKFTRMYWETIMLFEVRQTQLDKHK